MAGNPPPWTLIKTGWIKKYKTKKSKYFVLSRECTGSVYLEYFESEKKSRLPISPWNSGRSINITETFYIQKHVHLVKNKEEYTVDIFTSTGVFVLLFLDHTDQGAWYDTIMKEKTHWFNSHRNESMPECLFEHSFDHVWQVTVTKKGIGSESGLSGLNRLCFTSKVTPNMLLMYKVETPLPKGQSLSKGQLSPEVTLPSGQGIWNQRRIEMPLNQVRKVARSGTMFHIELGRSSTIGEGALFMTADETSALNMHEIIRNAMATKVVQRSSVSGHPPMVDGHGHRSDSHRLSESHRHRTDSYGNRPDAHSHTSSPASSPPTLTILSTRHDSITHSTSRDSKSSRSDSKSSRSDSKTLTSSTGEDIYVEMGPGSNSGNFGSNSGNFGSNSGNFGSNAGNVSTPSSCTEEQGYLEMNMDATVSKAGTSSVSSSLDQDPGYLDMSPVSSSLSGVGASHGQCSSSGHPGSRARTGTTGSVRSSGERRSRSGRGIFDVDPPELPPTTHGGSDDAEFPLEKVRSFLEESGENESVLLAPVRAYSIGSRPTTTRLLARHGGHGHGTSIGSSSSVGPSSSSVHQRVRSNTVGSRPPAFSPPSLSAASSTSSHLLSSTSKLTSSSNDQMDHMEIDYTNSSSTSGPAIRKLSQGHRARSDSKSSTSSTASASVPVKVKEEPWEAHLPSTLATHSSPLSTGGQGSGGQGSGGQGSGGQGSGGQGTLSIHFSTTASQSTILSGGASQTSSTSSSLSQTIVGASSATGSSDSAGDKTSLAEGESTSASDKSTSAGGKSTPADVLPSPATVSSANEQSSSAAPQEPAADTEPVSASSATSVAQSSESASSSSSATSSAPSSAPSSTAPFGPAKLGHSSASGHHSSSKRPSSVTKSSQPGHSLTASPHSSMRAPSLLPSLPESTTGSIGSLSSLKKETSPEVMETGNDDSVTYTVIDFRQQEKQNQQMASSEATNIASSS